MEQRTKKLRAFYKTHRRMPSITELMDLFSLRSRSSAFYAATQLINADVLRKDRAGKLVPGSNLFSVRPVGRIRAGFAAPAEEELADTISLGEYLLEEPDASYLLNVEGDSMQDAGILDGDTVIFVRTHNYKPGDIVVALTEDGYTLKYLRKERSRFYLEAANDAYPKIYPKEGQIIGKVVGSFRKY